MQLIVNNKVINTPIQIILDNICKETGKFLFKDRDPKGDNLHVTCPCHKNGQENNPSCNIFQNEDNEEVEYGWVHCFSCGYNVSLPQMVADCFDESLEFGKEWLAERFGNIVTYTSSYLPPLEVEKKENTLVDELTLQDYNYYNPYMFQRKLTREVVDKFNVGATSDGKFITFPIYDEKNNLVGISKRSTTTKKFILPEFENKPIYLFNYVKTQNYPFVVVCEAQLDALTSWSYGVPAIALLGVGSKYQYNLLNKSGIRTYVTFFDNDVAGKRATENFNRFIRKDVVVVNVYTNTPGKKDINDLTKEEFDQVLNREGLTWRLPNL